MKHSGPWQKAEAPNDACCHDVGVETVARPVGYGYHVADVADEEDAPLIIAAPDLYDACAALVEAVDAFEPGDSWEAVNAALALAKTAIAKANGQ